MTSTTAAPHPRFAPARWMSPYYEGTERAGARVYGSTPHAHVPWDYGHPPGEEYRAVTERVVMWDTHSERQIAIRGSDALAFADYVVTRDMLGLEPGRCTYTFVCDEAGKIICDPVVLVLDEHTVWLSVAGTDLELWLRGIATGAGHDVHIAEMDVSPIQVQGPRSRDVLRKVVGDPIDELRFFRCMRTTVAGRDAVVSRTGWTGELGFEIYPFGSQRYPFGAESGMALWDALLEAGEEFGMMVTPYLVDRALESGITIFFYRANDGMNPLEFWRDTVVDLDGGDFIGKKALLDVRDGGGPARKMVGLRSGDGAEPLPRPAWPWDVLSDGQVVGSTHRVVFSPALRTNIAMAVVTRELTEPGTVVEVEHPGGREAMQVTPLPFIDPEGARVRS
jgi:glycine cleavage system aminomethyltransferase T